MLRAVIAGGLAVAIGAAAQAQEVKHFKTWIAACDNVRACKAFGFTAEDADHQGYLVLSRKGGPGDAPQIILQDVDQDTPAGPVTWRAAVDGQTPGGLAAIDTKAGDNGPRAVLTPAQTAALIAALRNGSALTLTSGKSVMTLSLAGAAASLLWIDDRQRRAGTTSALAAKGPKLSPPAPAAPVVRPVPLAPQAHLPTRLPAALKQRPELKDCDDHAGFEPLVARLSPGRLMWAAPCSSGAYNQLYVVFVADEVGADAKLVRLPDAIPAASGEGDDVVMNLGFDPKTGVLSAFAKARGLGDCGELQSWVWDGQAFKLIDESAMPDCRAVGPDDWPSVFHAHRAP